MARQKKVNETFCSSFASRYFVSYIEFGATNTVEIARKTK